MAADTKSPHSIGGTYTGRSRERWRRNIHAYLYLVPALVLLLGLTFYPLVRTFYLSVRDVNLLRGDRGFTGFTNFTGLLSDTQLVWPAFWNSIIWTVGSVAGEYILGLFSAAMLNLNLRGRSLFRMLMLIPWTVPIVIAAMLWRWILDPSYGIANVLLVRTGILEESVYWLGRIDTALASSVFINIWRTFPFYTITLLAAMQSVPRELYEAASLDGAGAWQKFMKITMPHLRGVSMALIILHVIWTFNNVDFIWLLTEGGPLHSSETLATLVYRMAFRTYEIGNAAALSILMIIFLLLIAGIYALIIRGFRRWGRAS